MKTIEERAKEYASTYIVNITGYRRCTIEGYLAGATEQKAIDDQQFKEYLEKRLSRAINIYERSDCDDYNGGYMDAVSEIIKELFKEK